MCTEFLIAFDQVFTSCCFCGNSILHKIFMLYYILSSLPAFSLVL